MALWSIRAGVTLFVAPALKSSTLLEVTEIGTIYSHKSYARPTRCTHVCLGLKGDKKGLVLSPYRHCQIV